MEGKERESIVDHKQQGVEKVQKKNKWIKIGAAALMLGLLLVGSVTARAIYEYRHVEIEVTPVSAEILQGEEVPEFQAEAVCTEPDKEANILNTDSGFKVSDLVSELNEGKDYTLACGVDNNVEGAYAITVNLTDEFMQRLSEEWNGRVTITMRTGQLTVKNKIGEWEDNRFRRWDGSYITSDFLEYDGDTYYFNSEGEMVTDVQQIGIMQYTFDEDGKLLSKECKIDPDKPMMALTFDDGPGEYTAELLAVLEKYNAHATFFMLGQKVSGREAEIQKMLELGCEIGNHSYSHPQLSKLSADAVKNQIGSTNDLLKGVAGVSATVMRPPYGDYAGQAAANVKLPIILWNVDTLDWKTRDAQQTIANVKTRADDGDIVLMHDIHKPTVDAASELIPYLISEGYQLVTVSELAQARGASLEPGKVYTDFNR